MKVIGPLFLDDLKAELARLRARKDTSRERVLLAFQDKLAGIKCFDPACGCGNFLVIAYRELRALETEVILDLSENKHLFTEQLSKVDVDQFYGIEIEEFPARIAETALWMMDHIMNQRLSDDLGEVKLRIPLRAKPTIRHGDALEVEWPKVLLPEQCSYVLGNPPFIGKHLMSDRQSAQVRRTFNDIAGSGNLDFVTAWYLLAARYIRNRPIECAFVSTNSITQGEQVSVLWSQLSGFHIRINFAHRTFAWGSEAKGKANVHCVIIGFSNFDRPQKRLFDYADIKGSPIEIQAKNINAYLLDFRDILVNALTKPIADVPPAIYGSKPVDDGALLLSDDEKQSLIRSDSRVVEFIRPMISNIEFLHGEFRWCIWLADVEPSRYRSIPAIMQRVNHVREFRLKSKKVATQKDANRPMLFAEIRQPRRDFIVIPLHTSENREYVPFGFFDKMFVVHNSCTFVPDGGLVMFGLMSSKMHMSWLRNIGGRIKSDFRYSGGLVYNPFPWPDADDAAKERIGKLAEAVLAARRNHPTSTLADLYDPLTMPPDLRKAHTALDLAVDRLYRKEPFATDRERVEFLLARYEQITAPALALAAQKPKRVKKAK